MKDYTAIPGLGTGRSSFHVAMRHRLYQAADHLLLVQSTGFTDDYRRLFYRDIGHVVVRQTQRQMWLGIVLGVAAAVPLGIALYSWSQGFVAAGIAVALGAAVIVLFFVMNLVRGPTCVCYITTQVQTVEVPTPQRMAKVPRLIEFLREKTAGETGAAAAPQA
jgi:hypothetical protein